MTQEDVGKCAFDMDFIFDADDLAEDFITRKPYSSPSNSSDSDSQLGQTDSPTPCLDRASVAKEDPYGSLDSSQSNPQADDVAVESASSSMKLRQTVTKVPPLVLSPHTAKETRQASFSTQDDQPKLNKMRAVMIEIHFY